MKHIFDKDIAVEYGINCAVILENMNYWIEKNRANEVNFYDGYYWTYNSVKAFKEQFPYLSSRQISTALKKLEDDKLIITGNYNKLAYDRTKWYAITEKGESLLNGNVQNVKSIMQKCKMEDADMQNGFSKNVKPIPNINTNINTNIIDTASVNHVIKSFNQICVSLPHVSKVSDKRKKAVNARLHEYSLEEIEEAFEKAEKSDFLKGNNNRGWKANFDWLINPNNMAKVLEGNYNNSTGKKKNINDFESRSYDMSDLESMLLEE